MFRGFIVRPHAKKEIRETNKIKSFHSLLLCCVLGAILRNLSSSICEVTEAHRNEHDYTLLLEFKA